MSRHQPAEVCSNRSSCRNRSSRSKHREIARDAKEDVALHYLSFDTSPKLTSESPDRENAFEFLAETSSQSAPNVSVARNSRQIFTEHQEFLTMTFAMICTSKPEIFGKLHKSTVTLAVDGFDFAEKMTCAWRPFYSYTTMKGI